VSEPDVPLIDALQLELSADIFEDIGSIVDEFQEETKSRLNFSVYMA
jgi:hypothetical protein